MSKKCCREMDAKATEEEQAEEWDSVSMRKTKKEDRKSHKNGIHFKFSISAEMKLRWPRRYSKRV